MEKPIISHWEHTNPCVNIALLESSLTDVNIINTKNIDGMFIKLCIKHKDKIFLHFTMTGMGQTKFEKNIPSVKQSFFEIKKLLDAGFPQKQLLIHVNPILPNTNGLRAVELLLKLFSEFKELRLRYIRFTVLAYRHSVGAIDSKYTIANNNIGSRHDVKQMAPYLIKSESFFNDYYKLIDRYKSIITVDPGTEALVGIRELLPFGFKNEWYDEYGVRSKLITYEKNNRFKPILNIISPKHPTRCLNKCLLCPLRG